MTRVSACVIMRFSVLAKSGAFIRGMSLKKCMSKKRKDVEIKLVGAKSYIKKMVARVCKCFKN